MTMARIGNSKKAFADLDKAISLKPTDPKSYFIRALIWEASDPDKAIADLDQAIELDPTNADYRKERLSVQLDKRKTGAKAAQQAPDPATSPAYDAARAADAPATPAESPAYEPLQLYPKKEEHSELVALSLKRGLEQQAQANVGGAIDTFSFAIQLDPYNAEAFHNRALAEASQGAYTVAAADCRRAIELDTKWTAPCNEYVPDDPARSASEARNPAAAKVLIKRAEARLAEYSVGGALLDLAKAISLDPKNADAYLVRSRARALNGDATGAAADCQRAIELDPRRAGTCGDQVAGGDGKPTPP